MMLDDWYSLPDGTELDGNEYCQQKYGKTSAEVLKNAVSPPVLKSWKIHWARYLLSRLDRDIVDVLRVDEGGDVNVIHINDENRNENPKSKKRASFNILKETVKSINNIIKKT